MFILYYWVFFSTFGKKNGKKTYFFIKSAFFFFVGWVVGSAFPARQKTAKITGGVFIWQGVAVAVAVAVGNIKKTHSLFRRWACGCVANKSVVALRQIVAILGFSLAPCHVLGVVLSVGLAPQSKKPHSFLLLFFPTSKVFYQKQ